MCEEVRRPAVQVPNAIVGAVVLNMVAGLCYIIPIAFVLPDTSMLSELSEPIPTIFLYATGNNVGAFCLTVPVTILGVCSGITCVTSTSRCTWAFARDRALPFSNFFSQVNKSLGIPFNALVLGMIIELLLGLIYFGSSAAFSAFSGVGVIFLTLSYTSPIACSFFLRGRKDLKHASYNLGYLGVFCNLVCIGKSSSVSRFYMRLTSHSMVSPGHPLVLHANGHSRYPRKHELCRSCVRWFHHPICGLVHDVWA